MPGCCDIVDVAFPWIRLDANVSLHGMTHVILLSHTDMNCH